MRRAKAAERLKSQGAGVLIGAGAKRELRAMRKRLGQWRTFALDDAGTRQRVAQSEQAEARSARVALGEDHEGAMAEMLAASEARRGREQERAVRTCVRRVSHRSQWRTFEHWRDIVAHAADRRSKERSAQRCLMRLKHRAVARTFAACPSAYK